MIRYLREVERLSSVDIRRMIEGRAADLGVSIPADVRRLLIADVRTGPVTPIDVLPQDESCVTTGRVLSADQVNVFRTLGFHDNVMGRGLLGELASEPYLHIVLREAEDEVSRFANRFSFYFPLRSFDWSGVRVNTIATAYLVPRSIPGKKPIWIADDLHPKM